MKLQCLDFFLCLTTAVHISCDFYRHLTLDANFKWQITLELQYACPSAKSSKLLLVKAVLPQLYKNSSKKETLCISVIVSLVSIWKEE